MATAEDQRRFYQKARELGLSAANTYSWDWSTSAGHHDLWDAVAAFHWPPAAVTPNVPGPAPMPPGVTNDPLQHYVDALNNRDIDLLVSLYHDNAGHVNAQRMVIGIQPIRDWYQSLLKELLPAGTFAIDHVRGKGSSWTFNWTFQTTGGQMAGGKDTLGLRQGRIQYHYSSFAGARP